MVDIQMNQQNDNLLPNISQEMKIKKSCTSLRTKKRKFEDKFGGLTECQLIKRTLPDYLAHNLDLLIIGINPGYTAAFKGHHYAGPGNHFWKCLHLSQIIDEPLNAFDDYKLLDYNLKYRIGFTNIVQRTTRGSDSLSRAEIKEGSHILKDKLRTYAPKIAVFNGKGIYEIFSGSSDFNLGLQSSSIGDTKIFVMPSSSARCSNLPRATDKLPFYIGLRKLLEQTRDQTKPINLNDFVYPKLKSPVKRSRSELWPASPRDGESGCASPRDGESGCSNSRVESCLLLGKNMFTATKVSGNQHKLFNASPHWATNKTSCDKLCNKDGKVSDHSKVSLLNFSTSLITSHYFNK